MTYIINKFDLKYNITFFAGFRIIIDFVPNHTSIQHEWFEKSVQRFDLYTDYYTWLDEKKDDNGNQITPNNWVNKINLKYIIIFLITYIVSFNIVYFI